MRQSARSYSVAGVLVRTSPADMAAVADRLAELDGIDVHHTEPATGRIVITLEATERHAEREQLESLRLVPGVVSVELVYHYTEPEAGSAAVAGRDGGDS